MPVLAAGVVAVLAYLFCGIYCSSPVIAVALALLFLFRDPACRVPPVPLGVVSPVCGEITKIAETMDPFLGRKSVKMSIRMQALGPYVLRSAIEGQIMQQWHLLKGLDAHLLANLDSAGLAKDPQARQGHFAMWIQTDEADDVVIAVRGPLIPHRLHCSVQTGERIGQGQRCGLSWFPAAVDVYFPVNSRIEARQGAAVRGGEDILATLIHREMPVSVPAVG